MSQHLGQPNVTIFERQTDIADIRLKNIVRSFNAQNMMDAKIDVGILGIPYDKGVKNSKGRVGAAKAPDAIRRQLKKYGTVFNVARGTSLVRSQLHGDYVICDIGDVAVNGVKNHSEVERRVTKAVYDMLQQCSVVITLGGGNDLSFPTVWGLAGTVVKKDKMDNIGGMNVDAHLDVREVRNDLISSGMPYRLLINHQLLRGENLFEVGIQGHVNAKAHFDWAKEQGVHIWTLEHVRSVGIKFMMSTFRRIMEKEKKVSASFVSIDMDSVAQAFAPGVSAPNPDGFFPQDIFDIAYVAGTMPCVRLFEIMEVNPKYDVDNRTSRLAANIILEFLAGYSTRQMPS